MSSLHGLKPWRALVWSAALIAVCVTGYPRSGRADVSISVGVFIVDGFRYKTIGDAYSACTTAAYTRCEIWDYNLIVANSGNGEVMDSLPWDKNGSGTPIDLRLGPGTLKICNACTVPNQFTFVVPRLSHVTGVGRTSSGVVGGTVIQAGTNFSNGTLVQIGDGNGSSPSFGSMLSNVTVDCNYVASCIGIENFNGQEQSGLEHVNVVNYATKGLYIHSANAQNSHYTDVEVNGCLISGACIMTSATVPLEIDNVPALRPIEGITVNPVNIRTLNPLGTATYVSPNAEIAVTSSSFVAGNWVSIANVGVNGYNGTYQLTTGTNSSKLVYPVPGPLGSSSGGTASLVPTYDVFICSGASPCTDTTPNPTPVTFVGAHFEHGQYGIDAHGASTMLDLIGGSCPNTSGYSDVATCVRLENPIRSAHIENVYPGPATVAMLVDDNFSYTTNDQYIQLYDIGSLGSNRTRHCSEPDCSDQVTSLVVYGGGGTATIQGPGSGTPTLTLPASTGTFVTSAASLTNTAVVVGNGSQAVSTIPVDNNSSDALFANTTGAPTFRSLVASDVPFSAPGPIGGSTPNSGAFTTLSATGQFTSTLVTGTAPFAVLSTTTVANLSAASVNGKTFPAPGAIGGSTPGPANFTQVNTSNLLISSTTPTISSGFGASASITASNGTGAFRINVGSGGTASSGVIGLPTASTGWNCFVNNISTTNATVFMTKQTGSSTTTATIGNFTETGATGPWGANNILLVSCFAF
jgi:hypothetical protein